MPTQRRLTLSRRDALKILAAAGATALTTLPEKWTTPELQFGALPVHAQTSPRGLFRIVQCVSPLGSPVATNPLIFVSSVTISPAQAGVLMNYSISKVSGGGSLITPAATGSVATDASGVATLSDIEFNALIPAPVTTIWQIVWTFANPAVGTDACYQALQWLETA